MEKRLSVGSLPYSTSEGDLESAFSAYGHVVSAMVIRDREAGRSRGFGFVEMETDEEAETAQRALDGTELEGRSLRVNVAQSREEGRERR